jgi:type I site-specific restriction endonuclease
MDRAAFPAEETAGTVEIIDGKADYGLEQAKLYADAKRLHVPFVFASNGYLFVLFDRSTGLTTPPRPLSEFPTY